MRTPDVPGPTPVPTNWLGRVILGRYRVEKVLGHGGMGQVFLAHDTLLHRRVALKRLRSDDDQGARRRRAILSEARRASQINDPRIAAIYDVLDLDDDVLIVMEYVDGTTLRARIGRPIPLQEFWDLSGQCIEAVAVAHGHGLVHRDIKPENLMVTRDRQIKILDFGIAKRAPSPDRVDSTSTTTTESGSRVIAGTPQYMAPEAHYGGKIDERTDIFSLGVLFYELLTAHQPFDGPTYESVCERVMNTVPPPVTEVNSSVGPLLSVMISRMMAKDPAQRYPTCADLMRALTDARRAAEHSDLKRAPHEAPPAAGARHRDYRKVATFLLAVAIGVLGWNLSRSRFAPALPGNRHVAVLAPTTPGGSEDFASFALGSIDLLHSRLQRHQDTQGFQMASFQEGLEERIAKAADARKVLGVNLAIVPVLEQGADVFRGRIELWDAAHGRVLRSRTVEIPLSRPFDLLDRVYRETSLLLGLTPRREGAAAAAGVRGPGTLRFLLQGIGRIRSAKTEDQARRAVDDFELACRAEPEAATARAWLASAQHRCYLITNRPSWLEKAEATAREAVALDSTRAEAHRMLGAVFASERNPAASLGALARACELNPGDDDAWSRLGRTYGRLGQAEREKETYLAVIARRPHCWQPHWWLATWHFRQGHVDDAIRTYEEMVRRAPDLYRGHQSLGGLLVLRGDYDRAVESLQRALALRPTKIAFDNLGTAYFNSGRLNESIQAYNQSFQFGFADYGSWLNLGDAYYWTRSRDQASEAYAQAIRLGREEERTRAQEGRSFDVMIPANLATVFPKLGQPDSARADLKRALEADSTNSMVQYCAAITFWQLREKSQAMAWLAKAVQGGYPPAWLRDSPIFREWRAEEKFRSLIADAGSPPQQAASRSPGERR